MTKVINWDLVGVCIVICIGVVLESNIGTSLLNKIFDYWSEGI